MSQLPLELIRQAVSAGEFGRAQILWKDCAAGLAEDFSNGCLSEARLKEVRELVEWSRMVVVCARAHLQDRLNSLHVAREYEVLVQSREHRLVSASF